MKKEKIKKWIISYKRCGENVVWANDLSAFKDNSKSGNAEFEGDGYFIIEKLEPSTTYNISIGREIETEGVIGTSCSWDTQVDIMSTENGEIKISFSGLYYKIE